MKIELIKERKDDLSYIQQILYNREIKNLDGFFDLNWDCVNPPFNLNYMKEAVDKFLSHIKNSSKIAIIVDCDMDGFSSSALLMNYIHEQLTVGDWIDYSPELIPMFHDDKIHGLDDKDLMKRIRDEIKPDLLMIPDASGTEEQYKAIEGLGIDIIVLDHHDTTDYGNGNTTIVVNNQHSENYSNKDLSGVGITWQFCRAIDTVCSYAVADKFLDLVAIGNIGDVMDMRAEETRFLCNVGMNNINSPFLQYMKLTSYTLRDKDYSPVVVSFNIAPLFNAVCRIGNKDEKEMLFKCLLESEANTEVISGKRGHINEQVSLVEEGTRLATNAKSRQDTRKNKLIEKINTVISQEELFKNHVIVLAFDDYEEDYKALSGLVASGLCEYYSRPVILTFKTKLGDYSGSLRAPDKIPAYANFKDQCQESGCCSFVKGHQQAAGICIQKDKVDALIEYFDKKYSDIDTDICEKVDFIIDANDPELPDIIIELAKYSQIWGTNIEAPKIAIKNVKISQSNTFILGAKKNTLKIKMPNFELINFKSSESEYQALKLPYNGIEEYYSATVLGYEPTVNEFRGDVTPQLQFSSYQLDGIKYDF